MPWKIKYVLEPEHSKSKIKQYLSVLTDEELRDFKYQLKIFLVAEGNIDDLFE